MEDPPFLVYLLVGAYCVLPPLLGIEDPPFLLYPLTALVLFCVRARGDRGLGGEFFLRFARCL